MNPWVEAAIIAGVILVIYAFLRAQNKEYEAKRRVRNMRREASQKRGGEEKTPASAEHVESAESATM